MKTKANIALRLTPTLKEEAARIAAEENTTLNQFISTAVAEKVSSIRTADFFERRIRAANADKALDVITRLRGGAPVPGDELPEDVRVELDRRAGQK
jgi:uncharacterized protein (DUF1778 family)